MATEFRVLGPVQACVAGAPIPLAGKPLVVLAGLLLRANTVVSLDLIEYWLWGDGSAPRQAKAAIQTYVMRLRQALGADTVRTVPGGYLVDADERTLDLLRFRALAVRTGAAVTAGDHRGAVEAGTAALAEWRGDPLGGVVSEPLHRDEVAGLADLRLDVWQDLIEAKLALGTPPITELRRLVRENPLRERFAEQLVLALYRSGRQADALAAYRSAARVLADEAGLEPGPALRDLQRAVLAADPALVEPVGTTGWTPPRQLPLDVGGFTGREAELAALTECAAGVVSVEGTAGVGKTALAVHFGHTAAADFPDGQVYLNLHGYGPGEPRDELSALELLLRSAGVTPTAIPAEATARAALWRTVTAGRRLLVVLDNARGTADVRPLLPGPGGLVLTTSRTELRGLVARDGARRLTVGRLGPTDARALLARSIGTRRVVDDPTGSAAFLNRCANLPLAVRILGERASRYPELPLTEFVAAFDDLAQFDLDDGSETDLRTVFAPSYRALRAPAAHLFRLLGAHPGPAFGVHLAAALIAAPVAETRALLDELRRAHLLEAHAPGRYGFHDLLRDYAAELVRTEGEHTEAGDRILDWYLAGAVAGLRWINPETRLDGVDVPEISAPTFAGRDAAVGWFDEEWPNLVAVIHRAAATGNHRRTWQLARCLQPYLIRNHRGQFDDWESVYELGLTAARTLGDGVAEGVMLGGLGSRCAYLRQYAAAADFLEQRLAVTRRVGDRAGEQGTLTNLGIAYHKLGRRDAALAVVAESAELAAELGVVRSRAMALANLAEINIAIGRFDEAIVSAGQAHELHPSGETLHVLGLAHAGLGDPATGADYLRRSALRHRDDGEQNPAGDSVMSLAEVYLSMNDPAAARTALKEALVLFERLGHPDADSARAKLDELG